MGTISDKLMRIINTKEDIRQALISKGYDVPTSIPFKEYAKMISDLPCRVDSFPDIEGIVARYSALGLTNEQMAENPVWKDLTGNGHDLQMKNFSWGRMSGIGGYNQNFNQWGYGNLSTATQTHTSYKIELSVPSTLKTANIYSNANSIGKEGYVYDFTLNIVGLKDGALLLITKGVVSGVIERIEKDGIYKIYQPIEAGWDQSRIYIFISNPNSIDLNITIEQLPIYPGALVFDGVDDYGTCNNFPILTKEKGYTVVALRQWISMGEGISGLVSNVKNWFNDGAFVLEYNSNNATNKFVNRPVSFGNVNIEMDLPNNFTYQTSKSYKGVPITTGSFKGTNSLFVGKLNNIIGNCSNVAIWELVFLDHDATEEELTKIKDYFVKAYPWLFPDQAWTVVGKTNEDEDRATITNITGNGNDLVLSNFGFAEGSGYGLYAYNFNSFNLRDNVVKPTDVKKDSFRMIGTGNSSNVLILLNESDSADWKIRITGMKEGDRCLIGNANKSGEYISVNKDGTYTFQKQYAATSTNGIWYNSSQEVDVLVEQIPEYEGYLVTDGVDDKAVSSIFELGKDFTVVGEWEFLQDVNNNSGLRKPSSFIIRNNASGLSLFIKRTSQATTVFNVKSLKAFCSNGLLYKNDWTEQIDTVSQIVTSSKSKLSIACRDDGVTEYDKFAFKNLAIYPMVLSKEDCIKAYNYLQTLKSK